MKPLEQDEALSDAEVMQIHQAVIASADAIRQPNRWSLTVPWAETVMVNAIVALKESGLADHMIENRFHILMAEINAEWDEENATA